MNKNEIKEIQQQTLKLIQIQIVQVLTLTNHIISIHLNLV